MTADSLRTLWCRLMHHEGWALYQGFPRPYVYCMICGRRGGNLSAWRQGNRAVSWSEATEAQQDAALLMFGTRKDRQR